MCTRYLSAGTLSHVLATLSVPKSWSLQVLVWMSEEGPRVCVYVCVCVRVRVCVVFSLHRRSPHNILCLELCTRGGKRAVIN